MSFSRLFGRSYISGSRDVSDFSSQTVNVVKYYFSFIVPIGFGLLATGWSVKELLVKRSSRASISVAGENSCNKKQFNNIERIVLLFVVWWILDMVFVWISPRNYVQYYLPLNASAAMLAAYSIYKCLKQGAGFVILGVLWLLTGFIFALIVNYLEFSFLQILPFVLLLLTYIAIKMKLITLNSSIALSVAMCIMIVCLNLGKGNNINKCFDRYKRANINDISTWKYLARTIKPSTPNDDGGLYVWGWFPGIYVHSQRLCPTIYPSESNMHSDSPDKLKNKIDKVVSDLNSNPPLFIVDSQKRHWPYYSPIFDLWPRNGKTGKHMVSNKYDKHKASIYDSVELNSYKVMTDSRRSGGAMPEDRARKLAQKERARHEVMASLRLFVMENYLPLARQPIKRMYVYKLKHKK